MNVFVINLKQDSKKRDYIKQHFNQYELVEYQFIDAIYGPDLSEDELNRQYDKDQAFNICGRALLKTEIGCTLSHCKAYKKIVDDHLSGAFIFEDDCQFNENTLNIMKRLITIYQERQREDILVLLTHVRLSKKMIVHELNVSNSHILESVHPIYATHGYYVTNQAAQHLLEDLLPVHHVLDDWRTIDKKRPDRHIYNVYPYCVTSNDKYKQMSTIEKERLAVFGKASIRVEEKNKSTASKLTSLLRETGRHIRYSMKGMKYQNDSW